MATITSVLGVIRDGNFSYAVKKRIRMRQVTHARLQPLEPPGPGEEELVVSLTSYGDRLQTVHLAIRSIMLQTVRPHRVVLYLDASVNPNDLPDDLLVLCDYGLDIRAGYEDLGPHKKYFYAFREFSHALVITIDDDLVYASDTIETLIRGHRQHPGCVIARRVHQMRFDDRGKPLPYVEWPFEWQPAEPKPSRQALATGGAGTLYPAQVLAKANFDAQEIKHIAKPADDLYLKVVEAEAGIRVAYAPNELNMPYCLEGTQDEALLHDNLQGGRNDDILKALLQAHGLGASDFQD